MIDKVTKLVEDTKCESYFEWPKNNDGWREPKIENLMKHMPHHTIFDGCAYGRKSSEGKATKKTWKIVSTHGRIKGFLNKQCICEDEHAQVRGKDAKASEGYTEEIVEVVAQCLLEGEVNIKPVRKAMTKDELELHQRNGHDPFDSRCKDCLLGGIKDRPHYKRANDREENTLEIDIARRFRPGKGEEGGEYKYLLVATLKAARGNWKEPPDEATEQKQKLKLKKKKTQRIRFILKIL